MSKIDDADFLVYASQTSSLDGYIKDGCLKMTSEVYGDGDLYWDSEKHYEFTKEDTEKLFSIISLDDFIELCKKGGCLGMEQFLGKHDINPKTTCI